MSPPARSSGGPYAIMRLEPLKDWRSLRAAAKHNDRTWLSENVDAGKPPPRSLIHADLPDIVTLARDKLKMCGTEKPEAGKNLAYEVIVTASPSWFKNASPDEYMRWREANVAWLKELAGAGLLDIVEHLDEETPHLHALALPLVQKAKKTRGPKPKDPEKLRLRKLEEASSTPKWTLSYHDLFGGHRRNMEKLQDRYHAAVARFGLQRGERGRRDSEVELGDGLRVSSERFTDKKGNRKNVRPQEYRQMLVEREGELRAQEACFAVASFARVIGLAIEQDRKAEEEERLRSALEVLAADQRASKQLANEQAAERSRLEGLARALAERDADVAAAKATALELEKEAEAEQLRQQQAAAQMQETLAKLEDERAQLRLRLAEAEENRQAAQRTKDEADEALQQVTEKQNALAIEQRQLGTAIGLLARGLDERHGLRLRPDAYVERGFAAEEDKLQIDEAQVYRKWPTPLRDLGIFLAKMMENLRALRDSLLDREKRAERRQLELDKRETELAERSAKLAGEEHALREVAEKAANLMDAARRESDRVQQDLVLNADWSRILNDLAEDKLQLVPGRAGGWTVVESSEPIPPRLQQRLQEPGPPWAEAALARMKTLESGASFLAKQEQELGELKAKLTEVVAMADRAFTPSQKSVVEAATSALAHDQQAAARAAAQRGSSVS